METDRTATSTVIIMMLKEGALYNFELKPQTRFLWKKKGVQELKPILQPLKRELFRSELQTVAKGQRKCATVTMHSNSVKHNLEEITDLGLVFLPIRESRVVQGFAHKFYPPKEGEPTQIFGAVARDYETARKFKRLRKEGGEENADAMGQLLGYPKCCRSYFEDTFSEEFDPVWSSAIHTEGAKVKRNDDEVTVFLEEIYPEANPLLRYFGIRIVPHLPCSYTCEKSREFGRDFLKVIDEDFHDILLDLLSNVVWDCYKGVAIVDTPYFRGVTDSLPFKTRHKIVIGQVGQKDSAKRK